MRNRIFFYSICMCMILMFNINIIYAEEKIELKSYYPSPSGFYNELKARKCAIGEDENGNLLPIPEGDRALDVGGSAVIGHKADDYLHIGNNKYNPGLINPALYFYKAGGVCYGIKLQFTDGQYGTTIFGPNQADRFISFNRVNSGSPTNDTHFGTEYMRIDLDNGNVGIGTKEPQAKLEVNGNFLRTGSQCLGNQANTHINLGLNSTTGGSDNTGHCTVSGGGNNIAFSNYSTVSGGLGSGASGNYSTIGGGQENTTSGEWAIIGGGSLNEASGQCSTISGGNKNKTGGSGATVSGGHDNNLWRKQ